MIPKINRTVVNSTPRTLDAKWTMDPLIIQSADDLDTELWKKLSEEVSKELDWEVVKSLSSKHHVVTINNPKAEEIKIWLAQACTEPYIAKFDYSEILFISGEDASWCILRWG
jgi:hypothetical protein